MKKISQSEGRHVPQCLNMHVLQCLNGSDATDRRITRGNMFLNQVYNTPTSWTSKFSRIASIRPDRPNTVLVQYNGDEELAVDFPHGNAKNNARLYVRTRPSVLQTIQSTSGSAQQIYISRWLRRVRPIRRSPALEFRGMPNKSATRRKSNAAAVGNYKYMYCLHYYKLVLMCANIQYNIIQAEQNKNNPLAKAKYFCFRVNFFLKFV